jgi:ABC-type multidrug transport system permease subunit
MAKLVPAYYGLQAMRSALLTGGGLTDIAGDLVVLAAFAAVLVPVSLVCFARAVRIARISGTLGTY